MQPSHKKRKLHGVASPQNLGRRDDNPNIEINAVSPPLASEEEATLAEQVKRPETSRCKKRASVSSTSPSEAKRLPDTHSEVKHLCAKGHAMKQFTTKKKDYGCDSCYRTLEKGATMWGCRQCNYDKCGDCVSEILKADRKETSQPTQTVTSCPPSETKNVPCTRSEAKLAKQIHRCPNGHTMTKFTTKKEGFVCDACGRPLEKGATMWGCRTCDYDMCADCQSEGFKAQQIEASEANQTVIQPSEPVPYSGTDVKVGPKARVRVAVGPPELPSFVLPADARIVKRKLPRMEVKHCVGKGQHREDLLVVSAWPGLGAIPESLGHDLQSVLILGRSGSGKSSLLRSILEQRYPSYNGDLIPDGVWDVGRPIIEGFPEPATAMDWLCAVGLASVPAWFKPYDVLSRGEKYRANAARKLATRKPGEPAIFDEWTSELDRGVARAASLALAKALMRRNQREGNLGPVFFATCHEDITDYLACDVVIRCTNGAPPEIVFNAHADGAPKPQVPPLSAQMCGSVKRLGPNEDKDDGSELAVEGRWRAVGKTGQTLDFSIRSRRHAPRKVQSAPVCMNFQLTACGLGTLALETRTSSVEGSGEGYDDGGPCLFGSGAIDIQVRYTSEDKLQLHTRSPGGSGWTEMHAERWPSFFDYTGRVPQACYNESTLSHLRESGWYVPGSHLGEYADGLYQGLIRCAVEWLNIMGADSAGFRLDPSKENQKEDLLHLVAYVGDESGRLSDAILDASRFMDHPFDGLSVHVVTELPKEQLSFGSVAIVGPSGSGKTALATETFGPPAEVTWLEDVSVRAHFPSGEGGEEVLSVVGLQADVASRPIITLSCGEQFRARLARLLIHASQHSRRNAFVIDEFTSVLDRPAARQLSGRVQGYIRSHGLRQVVILSCHTDIIGKGMLEPDWVFEAHSGRLVTFGTVEDRLRVDMSNLSEERERETVALESSSTAKLDKVIKEERAKIVTIRTKVASVVRAANAAATVSDDFAPSVTEVAERLGQEAVLPHEARIEELEAERKRALTVALDELSVKYAKLEADIRIQVEAVVAAAQAAVPAPAPSPSAATSNLRLEVRRALLCEWGRFREHHYKDHRLQGSSIGLIGTLFGEPVAWLAMLPTGQNPIKCNTVGGRNLNHSDEWNTWLAGEYPESWLNREMWREHRTVVLPCFQGFGVGSLMADCAAYLCEQMGYAFMSTTVHPTYGGYRDRSSFWSALPSSQKERNTIQKNLKFSHAWVGATQPDGSVDLKRLEALRARIDWESLTQCVRASVL